MHKNEVEIVYINRQGQRMDVLRIGGGFTPPSRRDQAAAEQQVLDRNSDGYLCINRGPVN